MKILFDLIKFPEYGGISTVTSIIIPLLNDLGFEVAVVSHRTPNKEYDGPPNIKLFYMPDPNNLNNKINWEFYRNLLTTNDYDIIIYQDSYAPIEKMVCYLAREFNIKLIIFEHSSPHLVKNSLKKDPWFTIKGFFKRFLFCYLSSKEIKRKRLLYKYSYKYVLLSKSYIKEFKEYTRINESSKLCYINNPINIEIPSELNKSQSILFVGRLMPEKGIIKLLKYKNTELLRSYKFYVIGDGNLFLKCKKYITTNKINNIYLEGLQNPIKYYENCKVFWMNSSFEGWPMTLLEAMSFGCVPIVMNTFSAITDIIEDGINGFIIDYKDKANFINKTNLLLNDDNLFKLMSNNAKKKATEFSKNIIIKDWIKLLNS